MGKKNSKLFIIILILALVVVLGIVLYLGTRVNIIQTNEVSLSDLNVEYTKSELSGEFSSYTAKITLSDSKVQIEGSGVASSGNTITINSAGTYYITGTISDGTIQIDAGKESDVQLVLDNVNITSKNTSVINGIKANKLTITLAENSVNTVTDSSKYTAFTDTEKSEPDACIFSKTDLVINGSGKLIINANYKDGIVSKDGLKIINSELQITSADDAIRGKDYVAINNGNITINSKADGIKSTNDTDTSLGYVLIDSGNININAGDDGIHANTKIVINGGNININKSYEGIESAYIEINGGTINVVASDDGINICGGNDGSAMKNSFANLTNSDRKLVINGGTIKVNANGDGLDANGSIYINGGDIIVAGPTSNGNGPLDYDGECVVTGGNIIVYGSTGMWQNESTNSTQYALAYKVSGNIGDEVVLRDSSGNLVTSFKTEKTYQGIMISNSKIENGKTYTLYINGSENASLTVDGIVTTNGLQSSGMMPGGFGQGGMKQNGEMPQNMQLPNGEIPNGINKENGKINKFMIE